MTPDLIRPCLSVRVTIHRSLQRRRVRRQSAVPTRIPPAPIDLWMHPCSRRRHAPGIRLHEPTESPHRHFEAIQQEPAHRRRMFCSLVPPSEAPSGHRRARAAAFLTSWPAGRLQPGAAPERARPSATRWRLRATRRLILPLTGVIAPLRRIPGALPITAWNTDDFRAAIFIFRALASPASGARSASASDAAARAARSSGVRVAAPVHVEDLRAAAACGSRKPDHGRRRPPARELLACHGDRASFASTANVNKTLTCPPWPHTRSATVFVVEE